LKCYELAWKAVHHGQSECHEAVALTTMYASYHKIQV